MAKLCMFKDMVAVSSGKRIAVYDKKEHEKTCSLEVPLRTPEVQDNQKSKKSGSPEKKTTAIIQCLRICQRGCHLAACDSDKSLTVWSVTDSFGLVCQRVLQRNALCLTFLDGCQEIVVADKAGDVYSFDLSAALEDAKGKLLFGHLSLILDIVVSPNNKRIITCDRDEKIRVSCYPNCYNINSFCLGHSAFVIRMMLFPGQPHIMISASGDGTIKFWQYETGKLVHTIDCHNNVQDRNVILEQPDVIKNEGGLALKNIALTGDPQPTIAALFHGLSLIALYRVSFDESGNSLSSNHLQNISLQSEPWDASFDSTGSLLVISPTKNESISEYRRSESDCSISYSVTTGDSVSSFVNEIRRNWSFFSDSLDIPSIIPPLFKQWYDNVNTYLASKEKRLKKDEAISASSNDPESKRQKIDNTE